MSESIINLLETTRNSFIQTIEGISEQTLDIQPEGFNNTIRWHIGHALTAAEKFLFGYPEESTHLPESYIKLFGTGTKPADWTEEAPSLQVLVEQLKNQLNRIKEIPAEKFEEKLKEPFLGRTTVWELANLGAFHEAHHLGQIHAMKRIIEK